MCIWGQIIFNKDLTFKIWYFGKNVLTLQVELETLVLTNKTNKVMKAPEKIYLYPDDRAGYEYEAEWGDKPWGEGCVEYIRKDIVNSMLEMVIRPTKSDVRSDVFIEKACSGIEKLLSGYIIRNFHFGDSYGTDKLIEDFKNYMKEK